MRVSNNPNLRHLVYVDLKPGVRLTDVAEWLEEVTGPEFDCWELKNVSLGYNPMGGTQFSVGFLTERDCFLFKLAWSEICVTE